MEALKTLVHDNVPGVRAIPGQPGTRHRAPCTMQQAAATSTIIHTHTRIHSRIRIRTLTVAATLLLQGICVADCAQATLDATLAVAVTVAVAMGAASLSCTPVASILHATGY